VSPPPDLTERIADAVRAHPAVAGLRAGPFGAVASYLPGRRVDGVRLAEDGRGVELAVAVRLGARIPTVARELRAAVRELAGEVPVDVTIIDVVDIVDSVEPADPIDRAQAQHNDSSTEES
jgi:hypothetical protein